MIARSLAYFIGSSGELQSAGLGLKVAYAKTPDSVLSEVPVPFCLVTPFPESAQELFVIGDAQRKENPAFQVAFYCKTDEQARQFKVRFQRMIESAKSNDSTTGTHLVPGIDFMAFADLLEDNGDHARYISRQPGWSSTPEPIVYVNEDSTGEPISSFRYGEGGYGGQPYGGGYSIDYSNGFVTFDTPLSSTDRARATYKLGVIDFNIMGVHLFETGQETDITNIPQRYVAAFTLETYFYIKTNANRYL